MRRSRELDPDPVGDRHRIGCDEADCGTNCRRHDYFNDSRSYLGSSILCAHERTGVASWNAKSCGQKFGVLALINSLDSVQRIALTDVYNEDGLRKARKRPKRLRLVD